MKELKHLEDIFENYDTFVIDLWGVIHNGVKLNPKAIEVVEKLKKQSWKVFLDLKLHDIPNTVKEATKSAGNLGVDYLTIHIASTSEALNEASISKGANLKILGVSKDSLLIEGAVSERVVKEMAEGALRNTGSDFTISISGIAGPSGGTEDKPVGTVCFGIGSEAKINCFTKLFEGDRDQVREQSVTFALKELLKCLQ